jgi:hypothetical protein
MNRMSYEGFEKIDELAGVQYGDFKPNKDGDYLEVLIPPIPTIPAGPSNAQIVMSLCHCLELSPAYLNCTGDMVRAGS